MKHFLLFSILLAAPLFGQGGKSAGINGEGITTLQNKNNFLDALGGTTAGKNLFRAVTPGANSYPRVGADGALTWRDATQLKADLAIVPGDVVGLQTALANKMNAPVEDFPASAVIYCDRFEERVSSPIAESATRQSYPGPGIMTVRAAPAPVVAGLGGLQIARIPYNVGTNNLVNWPGVTAAPGLTMIIRYNSGVVSTNTFEFSGFSTSQTEFLARGGALSTAPGGGSFQDGFSVGRSNRQTATDDSIGAGLNDAGIMGQPIGLAVRMDSLTKFSYWMQGASLEKYGYTYGSNRWFKLGEDVYGTPSAATVYPSLARFGAGMTNYREMWVLSEWSPSSQTGGFDWKTTTGVHCPSLAEDPTTGLLVAAWNRGDAHESVTTDIRYSTRKADGTWTDPADLLTRLGGSNVIHIGSLSTVNSQLWLTYWRNTTVGGGTLYRRTLTVNPTTGAVTVGAEILLSSNITGTNNHALGPIITRGSTILLPYHKGTLLSYVARSTDGGSTWASITIAGSQPVGSNGIFEPSMVIEPDGAVACYMRSGNRSTYYSRSLDDGLTWSAPIPIFGLPTPGSGGCRNIARNMPDGTIWIIGQDSYLQRKNITAWRIGNNASILDRVPLLDTAPTAFDGTIFQYPDFWMSKDGTQMTILAAQEVNNGNSQIQRLQIPWGQKRQPIYQPIVQPDREFNTRSGTNLFTQAIAQAGVRIPHATTLNTNCRRGNMFMILMSGAATTTLAAPDMPLPWQTVSWYFTQSASNTPLVLNGIFETGNFNVTLSPTNGAVDILTATFNPWYNKWQVTDFTRGDGVNSVKNIRASAIPNYANDAAADADTALPSGSFYTVTGGRGLFKKP